MSAIAERLREVANDNLEYSGWQNLCRDALAEIKSLQSRLHDLELRAIHHPTDICDCRFDFTDGVMTVKRQCDYHKGIADRLGDLNIRVIDAEAALEDCDGNRSSGYWETYPMPLGAELSGQMPQTCDYLHAYGEEWNQCPPNSGPVRKYRWIDESGNAVSENRYCDDGARQAATDPRSGGDPVLKLELVVEKQELKSMAELGWFDPIKPPFE